ncbi:MAG: sigma-70 family RNA polymerase sigma factor [Muribaculaceae bacterium]|nr:sigma-70 family RNA polymerase sigma factor [Muribaculaceae bacterium]
MEQSKLTSAFMRFRDKLRGMAMGIVGSPETADDVLHDAFCRLWLNHKAIENETEAAKLTYTAVRNSAIDLQRRNLSHPSLSLEQVAELEEDDEVDKKKEQSEIYKAVLILSRKVLNEKQQQVFFMHDVEGFSYSEIADKMKITQDNVRQILSRARKTIREVYRKNEF